jgi:ubiquitin-protein ligase
VTHLQGPVDTPFEHGSFQLAIVVPDSYPLVPPNVRFVTRVFHPNVHFKVPLSISQIAYLTSSTAGWGWDE